MRSGNRYQRLFVGEINGVLRPTNLVVGAIGDSLTAQSVTTALNGWVQQDFRGALPWARALCGQRFYLPGTAIKGTGGNTLADMLARITDVTALSIAGPDGVSTTPGTVVIGGGVNDIGGGASVATTIDRMESCISALRAANQIVVFIGPTPQSSGTTWTAAQLSALASFRDYCRNRARPLQGVLIVDPWNDIAASLNGDVAEATMLRDTTHWHPKAAYWVGVRLAEQMARLFPNARPLTETNLCTNPELSGTAGSKSGGITGDVATSWTASTTTLTGDQTIVASKVDLGGGLFAQRFAISGTWGSASNITVNQTLSGWGTTYNIGDIMSFEGQIDVAAISPAPTSRFTPSVTFTYKNGVLVSDALINATEPSPSQALSLALRVERYTHASDSTRNTPGFMFSWPAGTHSLTVTIGAPKLVRHAS